jgi:hypothetical protein
MSKSRQHCKRGGAYTNVRFCIAHKLKSDSHVLGIIGSHENLGDWDPKKAAVAKETVDGQWEVVVRLPSKRVTIYRWAVLHRQTMDLIHWEGRGNRSFATTPPMFEMTVHCEFGGGETVESEPILPSTGPTSKRHPHETGKYVAKEPECFIQPRTPPRDTANAFCKEPECYVPPRTPSSDTATAKDKESQTEVEAPYMDLLGRVGLVAAGVGIGLMLGEALRRLF